MGKDPAFLFYDGDAARDVSHMNRLERGCYFDFIQAQKKFGPLTLPVIQKILGKDFQDCWPALKICLTYEEDMYFISWLQISIEKRQKYSEGRAKNRKGSKQPKNKEINSTYVPHMENEIVIENEIELLKEYDTWTEQITDGNDHLFQVMFRNEQIPAGDHIQFWIMDHRDLLNRYPKMRPPTQDAFRKSCLKHIRENYKKPTNGTTKTKREQNASDLRETLKNSIMREFGGG